MGDSSRFAGRHGRARFGDPLATVLSEEGNQAIHHIKAGGIDHRTAIAADSDKAGKAEPVEMKRERVGGEVELFGDLASRHSLRAGLHKQAKDFEPIILRERSERGDSIFRFHISTNIELMSSRQVPFGLILAMSNASRS
jgi:hypothetical protein